MTVYLIMKCKYKYRQLPVLKCPWFLTHNLWILGKSLTLCSLTRTGSGSSVVLVVTKVVFFPNLHSDNGINHLLDCLDLKLISHPWLFFLSYSISNLLSCGFIFFRSSSRIYPKFNHFSSSLRSPNHNIIYLDKNNSLLNWY